MKNNLCWVNYEWVITRTRSCTRDKVKVVLDLSNRAKKEWNNATGNDRSNFDFVDVKAKVNKLGINKLVNVPNSLNNLKTNVDADKIKTVPVDWKKVSNAGDKKFLKRQNSYKNRLK